MAKQKAAAEMALEPSRRSGRVALLASVEESRKAEEEARQKAIAEQKAAEAALAQEKALAKQRAQEAKVQALKEREHTISISERRLKTIAGDVRKTWRAQENEERLAHEEQLKQFQTAVQNHKRKGPSLHTNDDALQPEQQQPEHQQPEHQQQQEDVKAENGDVGLPSSILALRPAPYATAEPWPTLTDLSESVHWALPVLMSEQITTKWLIEGEGKHVMERRIRKEGDALGDRARLWRRKDNEPHLLRWTDITWRADRFPFSNMRKTFFQLDCSKNL